MIRLILPIVLALAVSAGAQSLGRLPGAVFPSDRGARTDATLTAIRSALGSAPATWAFDGAWVISGDLSVFQTNDVVYMAPGSRFVLTNASSTLSFNGALLVAGQERIFYGEGNTDGEARYPHLFPDWSGGWDYQLVKGYLDGPYEFSDIYSSIAFTNLAGNTNLLEHLRYMDTHIGDYAKQGYATTNQVIDLSNSVASALSVMSTTISNSLITLYQEKTAAFNATNDYVYGCNPNAGTIVVTLPASPTVGHSLEILEVAGVATTNKAIVVTPNGKLIMGSSENYTNSLPYSFQRFIFTGDTYGWRIF